MKIVLVVGWYYPEHSGGSEVYVRGLGRELKELGHEVLIAVPQDQGGEREYEFEGIRVYCYPVGTTYHGDEILGQTVPESANILSAWVQSVKPDLVHFHSWTRGSGYWHLRKIHDAGYPVYFTVHTAAPFCAVGTMKRWGRISCDGEIRPVRCSACYFHSKGLPVWLGYGLAVFAVVFSKMIPIFKGRFRSALRLPLAQVVRRRQLTDTAQFCQKIIAVCHWVDEALLLNGCSREKLVVMRQGCNQANVILRPSYKVHSPLKIGFLGRLDHVKGVRLLVDAFKRLPVSDDVVLELKGIPCDEEYLRSLKALISNDPRVFLLQPSSPDEVQKWLMNLDVLVVPSRWLETGPLVIYEAFAVGVPVIGVRQGGIAELIQHEVNGLLFDRLDAEELAKVLQRVVDEPSILERLRQNITTTRSMKEVGCEMDQLYRQCKSELTNI